MNTITPLLAAWKVGPLITMTTRQFHLDSALNVIYIYTYMKFKDQKLSSVTAANWGVSQRKIDTYFLPKAVQRKAVKK